MLLTTKQSHLFIRPTTTFSVKEPKGPEENPSGVGLWLRKAGSGGGLTAMWMSTSSVSQQIWTERLLRWASKVGAELVFWEEPKTWVPRQEKQKSNKAKQPIVGSLFFPWRSAHGLRMIKQPKDHPDLSAGQVYRSSALDQKVNINALLSKGTLHHNYFKARESIKNKVGGSHPVSAGRSFLVLAIVPTNFARIVIAVF